jgi:hypothetical protein
MKSATTGLHGILTTRGKTLATPTSVSDSGLGQTRPSGYVGLNVRITRKRTIRPSLFDHLVGAGEQFIGHGQAERLGSFEIDEQLEFARLLHR